MRIELPADESANTSVAIVAQIPPGKYLWILSKPKGVETWTLQGEGPVSLTKGRAKVSLTFPASPPRYFELAGAVVNERTNEDYRGAANPKAANQPPPTAPSTPGDLCGFVTILVRP